MFFGIFRYLLSNLVILAHLQPNITNWTGIYAVFGFYILSGFLMTYILNETYKFHLKGIGSYLLNRFLRIYPMYIFILLLSVFIIWQFPFASTELNKSMAFPKDLYGWIVNIMILGLGASFGTTVYKARIVPPSWALHIELIFYAIIPIVARNMKVVSVWLIVSILITIYLIISNAPFGIRYFSLWGTTLPFSIGAFLYYFLHKSKFGQKVKFNFRLFVLVIILWIINISVFPNFIDKFGLPFYMNIILIALIVLFLIKFPKKYISKKIKKLDQILGGSSYPIYLSHFIITLVIIGIFFKGESISTKSDQMS